MNLYCMCQGGEKQNEFIEVADADTQGVVLNRRMEVTKVGMPQFIFNPSGYSKHYPNVDLRECQNCGARIILE